MVENTPAADISEKPATFHFFREYWQAGLLLVLVSALAYLPMITRLGLYHNDWLPILSKVSGVSLFAMHDVDHRSMGILYTLTHRLLGDAPLRWHLAAWAVRTVGGLIFLWSANLLWPGRKTANLLMALFFMIYPGFLQTPSANYYLNTFIAFSAALLSLGLGIWAQRSQKGARKYTAIIVGALLAFIYLSVDEVMIGMEALRLVLSGYEIQQRLRLKFLQSLKSILLANIPFLLGTGSFVVYRLISSRGSNLVTETDTLAATFSSGSYMTVLNGLWNLISDTFEVILSAWFVPAYHLNQNSGMEERILACICGIIAVGVGTLWLAWVRDENIEIAAEESTHKHDAVLIGFLGAVLTLIPVVLMNRTVQFNTDLDCYTLPSSLPAAIFLGGLTYNAFRTPARWIVAAFLLLLAFFTHIPNSAHYVRLWEAQKYVWWQVSWRAPGLAQDTLVMPVLPEGYQFMEGFEAWGPLNLLYKPESGNLYVAAEIPGSDTVAKVFRKEHYVLSYRNIAYTLNYDQMLLLSMPALESCVHFVDGRMPEVSVLDDALVREVARYSRIEMVDVNGAGEVPPQEIFGAEPNHEWCYYYQKAALARQMGDWEEVMRLGEEAEENGLLPSDVVEWFPFLEAAMHLEEVEKANRIIEILKRQPQMTAIYCSHEESRYNIADDAILVQMQTALCGVGQ